jgi:hypothetical protein
LRYSRGCVALIVIMNGLAAQQRNQQPMKTKASKQPKQTKPAARFKDLAAKKNPKAGASKCPQWMCGSDGNHNETFVSDNRD